MAKTKIDRRERIILAAIRTLSQRGVAGTRLREIATAAKVDPPLLHYYFDDFSGLLMACVEYALGNLKEASLQAIESAGDDAIAQLTRYLHAPFHWAKKEPELLQLWIFFYYEAARSRPFRALNTTIRRAGRERIEGLILRGGNQGAWPLPTPGRLPELALQVQFAITGATLVWATEESRFEDSIRSLTDLVLGILGAESRRRK